MTGGDDSNVMTIEDAFAQTLADMEEAREELASAPVIESESPSLDSAFEQGTTEVIEEQSVPNPPMDTPPGPPMDAPPAGPPMMGPPMGAPPAGPPMMGPPMGAPPAGPPMMGPPMGAPPAGPPMMGPPMGAPPAAPPMIPAPDIQSDESTFQVADLSEITSDMESVEEFVEEEKSMESVESVIEAVSVTEIEPVEVLESPEINLEPEFNPVDADEFMSDFEDEWDETAPVRASDVDRTEDMNW